MRWEQVCAVALRLPLVEPGSYHGYPALRVRGKFLTRLGDDRASLEFKAIDDGERAMLLESAPDLYFLPDRFHGRAVFVRLSQLTKPTMTALLEKHWRRIAPKAAVATFDAER